MKTTRHQIQDFNLDGLALTSVMLDRSALPSSEQSGMLQDAINLIDQARARLEATLIKLSGPGKEWSAHELGPLSRALRDAGLHIDMAANGLGDAVGFRIEGAFEFTPDPDEP